MCARNWAVKPAYVYRTTKNKKKKKLKMKNRWAE